MKMEKQSGFVKLIILLVVVLIILGYFGFNIENILNSPAVSSNLHYVWSLVVAFWSKFILAPITWVWDKLHGLLSNAR